MPPEAPGPPDLAALLIGVVALLVVTAMLAVYGGYTALLIYSPYDDEGYLMFTRQLFLEGRPLYTDVYAQYGPFYYAYYLLLHGPLGVPITHTATRVLTLVHWLLGSAACGALVYAHARSLFCAGLAFLLAAGQLLVMIYSAGHPQELVALLTPLALLAASTSRPAPVGQPPSAAGPLAAIALGYVAAALVLTKINVGGFFVAALAFAYLSCATPTRSNRIAFVAAAAGAIALPVLVMRGDAFPPSWAFPPAAAAALGILALAFAAFPRGSGGPLPHIFPCVGQPPPAATRVGRPALTLAAAGVTAAAVCAVALARGTTLYGLFEGVVLGPLGFFQSYTHASEFPMAGVVIGAVSCAAAAVLAAWPRLAEAPAVQLVLALAKCAAAVAALYFAATDRPEFLAVILPPLLWLLIAPPVDPRTRFGRTLLAAAGALYVLQVYPWAGAQRQLGTFLIVPAAAVLLHDATGARAFLPAFRSARIPDAGWKAPDPDAGWKARAPFTAIQFAVLGAVFLLGLTAFKYAPKIQDGYLAYRHAEPLGLPGTGGIRPAYSSLERVLSTADVAPVLNWMTNNLRAHADSFIALPGLNSLYFWTKLSPPSGFSPVEGMTHLTEAQQRQIIDALARSERPCVIYNAELLNFWQAGGDSAKGPLAQYIEANFRTIQRIGTYEFLARNDRALDDLYISLLAGERAFDRSIDSLRLPAGLFNGFPEFSLSGWFRADAPGVVLGLERDANNGTPAVYIDLDGRLRCRLSTNPRRAVISEQAVADGAWHHLGIVTTTFLQRVFLEGVEIGRIPDPAPASAYPIARLGRGIVEGWPQTSAEMAAFHGHLADVRFYPRVLADAEIQQLQIQGQ